MTNKKYQIILADPPWKYADQGCQGTMANHYNGMGMNELRNMNENIKNLADKDCVLFMWATYPMLAEALWLIEQWGFKYKSIAFQWLKLNKKNGKPFYGLGRWTRGNTEPCLLATKGKPKRKAPNVFQLIQAPITKHSAKPPETRDKIVQLMGDLPRIELFARPDIKRDLWNKNTFDGWDVWGNEVESDIRLLTN